MHAYTLTCNIKHSFRLMMVVECPEQTHQGCHLPSVMRIAYISPCRYYTAVEEKKGKYHVSSATSSWASPVCTVMWWCYSSSGTVPTVPIVSVLPLPLSSGTDLRFHMHIISILRHQAQTIPSRHKLTAWHIRYTSPLPKHFACDDATFETWGQDEVRGWKGQKGRRDKGTEGTKLKGREEREERVGSSCSV